MFLIRSNKSRFSKRIFVLWNEIKYSGFVPYKGQDQIVRSLSFQGTGPNI